MVARADSRCPPFAWPFDRFYGEFGLGSFYLYPLLMVESLRELNRICQKPRYKEVGNWMVRRFLREAALPITWLLLHTPVTANQVTAISLVVALAGISFFSCQAPWFFLTGAVLLQAWYLLDHVDGQIARYRKTACLTGRFFDFLTHHLIHGVIFFSLGIYLYRVTGVFLFLLWGFCASLAMTVFNLINDTKYKAFFEVLEKGEAFRVRPPQEPSQFTTSEALLRKIFALLHKASEIHVLMNTITLASLVQILAKLSFDLRWPLFLFYGVSVPFLAGVKVFYLIHTRKIDQEFESRCQRLNEKDSL